MKTKTSAHGQTKSKVAKKSLLIAVAAVLFGGIGVFAATTPQLNQTINDGAKSVDIVDAGGASVASPAATFGALTFSFSTQNATATNVFTASQKIRVSNPTSTAVWAVNIAGNSPASVWTSGGNTYNFNNATAGMGQLTVDPSGAAIAGVSGCATTNVTTGTPDSFVSGTNNSIDLFSGAAGSAPYCRWDFTGTNLTQKIPAAQPSGAYSIPMTITIS